MTKSTFSKLTRELAVRLGTKRVDLVLACLLVWILVVGFGARVLLRYSYTPGRLGAPPIAWPSSTSVRPERGRATLVAFLHPHCPCSRATISELALIMARCRGKLDAYVFFYAPRSEGSVWSRTDLWREAITIPGVHAIDDQDGVEAHRFGASTSGQTLLYDTRTKPVFNGGITAARGHSGANDGRDAIVALLETGVTRRATTPVFGCSLLVE